MVALIELVNHTNRLLDIASFNDYCPNGLQVEGRPQIERLISGVTASRRLIDVAVDRRADALLVHHGYFWRGEQPSIVGMKRERLRRLLSNDISLIAYHLPLDAHAEYGNNVQLARLLGLIVEGSLDPDASRHSIGLRGRFSEPTTVDALQRRLCAVLDREPLHVGGGPPTIHSAGWCTGAAQDFIDHAAALKLDAYISGEISERTVHIAREMGIHYFAAGHHATERYGAKALGEHLAQQFSLHHEFVDVDNPA